MKGSRLARVAVLAATAWLMGGSAQAAPIFDFDGGGTFPPVRDTLGYAFRVTASVTTDGLGMFDSGAPGLQSAHEVALWNASNPATPLVSSILNPGTSTAGSDASMSGLGSFIYVDIAPLTLRPGAVYVLGASFLPANANKDLVVAPATNLTPAADVAFIEGRLGLATGVNVQYPSTSIQDPLFFGPMLRIPDGGPPAGIPEPMTLVLLVVGMVGIGLGLRPRAFGRSPQPRLAHGTLPA